MGLGVIQVLALKMSLQEKKKKHTRTLSPTATSAVLHIMGQKLMCVNVAFRD